MSRRSFDLDGARDVLENQELFTEVCKAMALQIDVAALLDISSNTVSRYRERYGIPLYPQGWTPPDWSSPLTSKESQRWTTEIIHAHYKAGLDRCPSRCPAFYENLCEYSENGVCPCCFYFGQRPDPDLAERVQEVMRNGR